MHSEFFTLGFDRFIDTTNINTINPYFGKHNRTGIYILHFANGEYYAGRTTDIVKRFVQHRHHFLDIHFVSFREVPSSELLDEQKDTIYSLEKLGKKFRDIDIYPAPFQPSLLDKVITPGEQEAWLDYEVPAEDLLGGRKQLSISATEDLSTFSNLKKSKYFHDISDFIKSYILQAVPFPARTEFQYWGCTSMPQKNIYVTLTIDSEEVVILRKVNVNEEWTEKVKITGLDVSFRLSKSKLFKNYSLQQLERKFPTIEPEDALWHPGRNDQQTIWMDIADALEFLDDADCLDAIKEYNLRLMRKGGSLSLRQHCVDLADLALAPVEQKVEVKNA